jgi:hypothetical protein
MVFSYSVYGFGEGSKMCTRNLLLAKQAWLFVIPIVVYLYMSCGGGGTSGNGASFTIKTSLSKGEVKAGEEVTVECTVLDKSQTAMPNIETSVIVTPSEGIAVEDHVLKTSVANTYKVQCEAPSLNRTDEEGATLVVLPSDPVETMAKLDPEQVEAGERAQVLCSAKDKFGNEITDPNFTVQGSEGLVVEGDKVWAGKVGQYEVRCSLEGAQANEVPATLTVVPSKPARVELLVKPDYKAYSIGDEVTLDYKVFDRFDNEVQGVGASFDVPQVGGGVTMISQNKFRFDVEGIYSFKVVLDAPYQDISDEKKLLCDQSPPTITILFPDRGQMFVEDASVTVKGTVSDIGGIKEVLVNNNPVELDEKGYFEYRIISKHGLNPIVVTASDLYGHSSLVTRGYYYSTKYLPVTENTKVKDMVLPEGAMVYAGQKVLDDGDHDPSHPNDLATIVEVLLSNLDLQSMLGAMGPFSFTIPNVVKATLPIPGVDPGLYGDLEIQARIIGFRVGSPKVGLRCRDGGLDTNISFSPVYFDLELTFILHASLKAHNPLDGKDYIYPLLDPSTKTTTGLTIGTLAISLSLDIHKLPDQELYVKGKDFQAEVKDISIDPIGSLVIDLGSVDIFGQHINLGQYDLSGLVGNLDDLIAQYVLNPLANFLTQPLINLLEPVVTMLIGDAIKQVMGMLAINQSIELPPVLGTQGTTMDVNSSVSSLLFTADGARVGLNLGVATKKGIEREPLGSILRDGCIRLDPENLMYAFDHEPPLQVGARFDLANELLFMLWWSGMLHQEFDLSSMLEGQGLPIENLKVTPDLYLPPIIDDCNEEFQPRIQLGDAYLDLKFNLMNAEQHLGVWLQLEVTGGIKASGTKIGLHIDKISFFQMEAFDIGGNMGDLMNMVVGALPGLLSMAEGQEFMFDVPEIDLGGVVPGVPQGTTIRLTDMASKSEHGVFVIGGDLQ